MLVHPTKLRKLKSLI